MLDLTDPPDSSSQEPHPHLRLVPTGPPVRFRVPEDPVVPWWVRAVALALGTIISGAVVLSIIFFGAFIKHVYVTIDARQKALQEQRRQAAPRGPEGSIRIVLPEDSRGAGRAGGADQASGQDEEPGAEGAAGGQGTGPKGSGEGEDPNSVAPAPPPGSL